MAYRYSEMGYDGCSCLTEDVRCAKCDRVLTEDEFLCPDCEREKRIEVDESTHCKLDELENFITNL